MFIGALLTSILFISAVLFIYYGMEIRSLKKRAKTFDRVMTSIQQTGNTEFLPLLGNLSIPFDLQTTPLANKTGLVLDSKKIEIRGVSAPYNPSMIAQNNGYLLFFRFDVLDRESRYGFYTYIGSCELDANFEQTEKEFTVIDTGTKSSEDPRAIQVGKEIYLVFNDFQMDGYPGSRSMHIGKLNLQESKLEFSTDLDLQIKSVEKNWVPFERVENGKSEIYFEYYLNPQKIMKLPNPEANSLVHLQYPGSSIIPKMFWPLTWGEPRGGSIASLINDQYLGFFHSSFEDAHKIIWYVIGAYTFDKDPPFRVTGISHYPILFEGIYDSPHMNTAETRKRVLFPGSFTEGMKDGKEVLFLCCGENDSSIKLITIDKQILLKTLKRL
jgi:predicted GH43/DUF377 family glycosyl hydrolase